MQRPVMNPYLTAEPDQPKRKRGWKDYLRLTLVPFKAIYKVLLWEPLAQHRLRQLKVEDGTRMSRIARGVFYRLAFVPLLIALAISAFVWSGTHPKQLTSDLDPTSQGIFYDTVNLTTDDGVNLEAWIVPVFDEKRVMEQREEVLRGRQPAVLLVHDFGNRRQQMLPLVRPLHEAGFVVMVLATRGCGPSQAAGVTFGLRETLDVKAAVETLRRRPFVDPTRVAVVGTGAGANAALLQADVDKTLAALVLERPIRSARQALTDQIGPHIPSLNWMRPLCKWAFEMSYQVDAEELDLDSKRIDRIAASRPVLTLEDATKVKIDSSVGLDSVVKFLKSNLRKEKSASASVPTGTATGN